MLSSLDRRPVSAPPTASNARRVASSAPSLITTFLPASRTMLAMGTYKAFPERFATIHPRYLTPSYALIAAGIGSALFYSILTFTSENVLTDTIYSLGIMICFYYGLTAFACIWYFRHELFVDAQSFVFKFLFPLLGGSDCSRSSWSRFATAPHLTTAAAQASAASASS